MEEVIDQIPLNKKNKDGSVNSYQEKGKLGHGYTVSKCHPKFRDQIEDKIWPGVKALNKKNYLTITSCEGHSYFSYLFNNGIRINSGPQISIVLESYQEKEQAIKKINSYFVKCFENKAMKNSNIISIRCRFDFFPMPLQRYLLNKRMIQI